MSIETQIAVVTQEMQQTQDVLDRLDHAIEKIADITADIGKILAVHEQRLDRSEQSTNDIHALLEKRRNEMNQDIKELHSRITTTTRELSTEINNVQNCIVEGIEDLKHELKEDQKYHNDKQSKLDERISALERWRYMLVGAGIVGGFLMNKILQVVEISVK